MLLRPGNSGAYTAADREQVINAALAALPGVSPCRPGKKVLIGTDGDDRHRWFSAPKDDAAFAGLAEKTVDDSAELLFHGGQGSSAHDDRRQG